MAENRRPLYAIIVKIDIERDWNTSTKDGLGMYPKSSLFLE